MKRILMALMIVLIIGGVAYAVTDKKAGKKTEETQSLSSGRFTFARVSTITTHRNAVSSNDASHPTIGSGLNMAGWKQAKVYVDVGLGRWDATPLFGDGTDYFEGVTTTVTPDSAFIIDINGSEDFYILVNGKAGSSDVTVRVQGIN